MEASGGVPGASRAPPGGVWKGSGGLLGGSREPPRELLAVIFEEMKIRSFLEASWRRLGGILGPSWGPLGAVLAPSWGHLRCRKTQKAEISKTYKNLIDF